MTLAESLAEVLPGAELWRLAPLQGGDLSDISQANLTDGRKVVLKRGPLVAREARMLKTLAAAGADTVKVIGVHDTLLVLNYLKPTQATPDAWRACGESLARVHRWDDDRYGWDEDYAFGSVYIPNTATETWTEFWGERRLGPSLSALPAPIAARLDALIRVLPDRIPDRPRPRLLHGDLWSGNIHFSGGTGVLIDPACYYGDPEVDLAMLELFGSHPATFLEGYGGLLPGYDERRAIYQLWPALVHVRLFGGTYFRTLERLLHEAGV